MFRNEVLYHSPTGDVLPQTSVPVLKAKSKAWVTYPLSNNIPKLDDKKMVICKVISCLTLQFYFWWRIQLQAMLLSETSVIRRISKHLSGMDYLLLDRCCQIHLYNTQRTLTNRFVITLELILEIALILYSLNVNCKGHEPRIRLNNACWVVLILIVWPVSSKLLNGCNAHNT